MKSKAWLSVIFAALLFSLALAPAASADVDVAKARVARTGVHPTLGTMVQLIDLTASPKWTGMRQFWLNPNLGNQGVATLLTAFSTGKSVWVRIAGTGTAGSLINILYINED